MTLRRAAFVLLAAGCCATRAALAVTSDDEAERAAAAFRAGDLPAAVAAFDRAAGLAFRDGAKGRALDLALAAAETQRKRGELSDAANRFQRAALVSPNDPRAAEAHHTACLLAAEAIERGGANAAALNALDALLAEHAAGWPDAPTAPDAAWRRVELLAPRGRWDELLARVRSVEAGDPRRPRAEALRVEACAAIARAARAAGDGAIEQAARDVSDALLPMIVGAQNQWPATWTDTHRLACSALADAHLARGAGGADYVAPLLRVALRGEPPPTVEWRTRAAAQLAWALVATGKRDEAAAWLESLGVEDPAARTQLAATLAGRAETVPPARWPEEPPRLVAALAAVAPATPGAAPAANTTDRAAALARLGRPTEALVLLRQRVEREPQNGAAAVEYARLLGQSTERSDLELGLGVWANIEARSTRGDERWREARLARLRLLGALGRGDELRKLLAVTRLLAPAGGEFAQQLDEVARE
jgi:tetratricopeptide (TPR) repeat protein